jgi:Ca-activated chloride channel family protein
MKSALFSRTTCLWLVLAAGGPSIGTAADTDGGDKTLSPYFFVKSDDPNADRLPLKSTRADVNVAGVIANVKVTQEYRNEGKKTLEAIYIFPGSTRAAVHAMKMTVGERVIQAEIRKREEARAEYQKALQSGQTASLLEQQRPNVFQMNVGNIQPGDVIKVEMEYTELLVPEGGAYEFVYPTVVGPRYSNQPSDGAPEKDRWSQNPYLHQGEQPNTTFDLSLDLMGGMPIQKIVCPSHEVEITWNGRNQAHVDLAASDRKRGNKDFILQYRLQGEKVETGLLLFKGPAENYFLLMAQPPKRLASSQIPPRDYIFIMDVSGSMHGFPLDTSKTLLRDLIGGLKPTDTFNVLLFSGGNSVLSENPLAATPDNLRKALEMIDAQRGGGGTELLPALKRALALSRGENTSRTVVIATDGYVTVESEAFDLIRNSLDKANLFAFGIGSSVNRFLMEGMARAGMGESFVVADPNHAPEQAAKLRRIIDSPALTRVSVDWGDLEPYEIEPPALPDVLAERPVIVFGKWRGTPGKVTVKGSTGEGRYVETVEASPASPKLEALRYLWARHRIATLGDFNSLKPDDKRVKEITDLGLEHHLLTAYTSFVAVDKVKRGDGTYETVKQPLPMPEGVSDLAVGDSTVTLSAFSVSAPAPAARYYSALKFKAEGETRMQQAAMPQQDQMKAGMEARAQAEAQAKMAESDKAAKADQARKAGSTATIVLEKITVSGSLAESVVRQWFESNRTVLEACMKDWTPLTESFEVVLKVHVSGTGAVASATVENPGRFDPSKAERLAKALEGLSLQAPGDGNDADVVLTLVIR